MVETIGNGFKETKCECSNLFGKCVKNRRFKRDIKCKKKTAASVCIQTLKAGKTAQSMILFRERVGMGDIFIDK